MKDGDNNEPPDGKGIEMPKQAIKFKEPSWILTWLDTALKKEKEKYRKSPILPDMVPGHESAQGWGFVVVGYFLVEEAFKALLHVRQKGVPKEHALSILFGLLDQEDKLTLREYYNDFRATVEGELGRFPCDSIEDFLENLDGDKVQRGRFIGSFDWRYFLIEEMQSGKMPLVSVDYLHEVTYGLTRIVEWVVYERFCPSQHTHSWRLRWKRQEKYRDWYTVRMNSEEWSDLGDRIEELWGPDYCGRYDLCIFRGDNKKSVFGKVPPANLDLPVIDKRKEIRVFDVEEGFRSIGVTRLRRR